MYNVLYDRRKEAAETNTTLVQDIKTFLRVNNLFSLILLEQQTTSSPQIPTLSSKLSDPSPHTSHVRFFKTILTAHLQWCTQMYPSRLWTFAFLLITWLLHSSREFPTMGVRVLCLKRMSRSLCVLTSLTYIFCAPCVFTSLSFVSCSLCSRLSVMFLMLRVCSTFYSVSCAPCMSFFQPSACRASCVHL